MNHLFWLDMEMSGLDSNIHRILEVALIVTDLKFNPLYEYETVVYQEPAVLSAMDNWCTRHHSESGLTARIPTGKAESVVEEELISIFQKYKEEPGEKCILAGNSIGQDRRFLERYMPKLCSLLHYRMLDVSSFKIVYENIYHKQFSKKKRHRALEDIQESIAELQYYLSLVSIP
jgi:oligoribonuclease